MKYITYKRKGEQVRWYNTDKCSYVEGGWVEPKKVYAFGDWGMKHPMIEPASKVKPMVSMPGITTYAENCRFVPDAIANEIDSIEVQIKELINKKYTLLNNEFLTFPLVKEGDLPVSTLYKRYNTKTEANKHGRG
jgi:hypothetical protein